MGMSLHLHPRNGKIIGTSKYRSLVSTYHHNLQVVLVDMKNMHKAGKLTLGNRFQRLFTLYTMFLLAYVILCVAVWKQSFVVFRILFIGYN